MKFKRLSGDAPERKLNDSSVQYTCVTADSQVLDFGAFDHQK